MTTFHHHPEALSVWVESDECGFELHVSDTEGERHVFNIQAIAEDVYDNVKAAVGPWLYEKYQAKAEYDRMKRAGDTRLLSDEEFSAYIDDAYGDDFSKRVGMEQAREGGYA